MISRAFGQTGLVAAVICNIAATADQARAAELSKSIEERCNYHLTGPISADDALAISTLGLDQRYEPVTLCLDSVGGTVADGIAMFEALWAANVSTKVLVGDTCAGACAIAFMGGGDVAGTRLTRQMARGIEPGAVLTFPAMRDGGEGPLFSRVSTDKTPALPAKLIKSLNNGPLTIETVRDAVQAGIDLLTDDTPIETDAQLINICKNARAAQIRNAGPEMPPSDYKILGGNLWVSDLGVHIRDGLYNAKVFAVLDRTAAAQTGDDKVICALDIVTVEDFDDSNTYGDPAYSSHAPSRIRVAFGPLQSTASAMEGVIFTEVPEWYAYAPDMAVTALPATQ